MPEPIPNDPIPLEESYKTTGPNAEGMMTHAFYAFNTEVYFHAYCAPDIAYDAFNAARKMCRNYERLFSRTLPSSDVSRINAAGTEKVRIHQDTAVLLRWALDFCKESEDTFDITVGSAMRYWDFQEKRIASAEELREVLPHINWRFMNVGSDGPRISRYPVAWKSDPLIMVDLGGVAKGWIADKLGACFERFGISSYIINLGGNVLTHGQKPNGKTWNVGLQHPFRKDALIGSVPLGNASAVTSGIYERGFEHDGVYYHHILNPKTGYPVQTDLLSATVISEFSLYAEGYSTILLALGLDRATEFVKRQRRRKHIDKAVFVTTGGKIVEV